MFSILPLSVFRSDESSSNAVESRRERIRSLQHQFRGGCHVLPERIQSKTNAACSFPQSIDVFWHKLMIYRCFQAILSFADGANLPLQTSFDTAGKWVQIDVFIKLTLSFYSVLLLDLLCFHSLVTPPRSSRTSCWRLLRRNQTWNPFHNHSHSAGVIYSEFLTE